MTWDTDKPRSRARGKSSSPQGWNDPGWWDEAAAPAPAPAPRPASSVRSSGPGMLRRSADALPDGGGTGDVMAARRTRSRGGLKARSASGLTSMRFALGFGVGIFGALFFIYAATAAMSQAYDGKIMPGVHAGEVDLSGLTREQAIARLDAAYAYLGKGEIQIATPGGKGTISFAEAGRGPDSAAMADEALAVGRASDPISSAALTVKTFATGGSVPIIVKLDPMALEMKLHELTGSSAEPATDAAAAVDGADYKVIPGVPGRGIDENAIARNLIDQLAAVDAPSTVSADGEFVALSPNVTQQDAQAAIDSAKKMSVDLKLTSGDKSWTVAADTVRSWIVFGYRSDGTYGPVVNPASVETYVNGLAKEVNVAAKEPKVTYSNGAPTGIQGGTAGVSLNVATTAQAVSAYLDGLSTGTSTAGTGVELITDSLTPSLSVDSLKGFVIIGAVTTYYYNDVSNGGGVNIALPAQLLNGQVIAPGEHFSFLRAVGPIDAAHGWKPGGVIKDGKSNHTGAMGGGICSASTTVFQTAATAGLQIDERHAHFYWITRYALDKRTGLDATVYSNGVTTWDMRFTNDTDYPIVIRSWTSGGTKKYIHVQMWSLPNGRKTTFTGGSTSNVVKATDATVYGAVLAGGAKSSRAEYPTNGFDTSVTRTVTDKDGVIVHSDTWKSHYGKVDGLLLIAGTKPPTPGPSTPAPTPPPATLPPAPTATPTSPRRRWDRVPPKSEP